MVAVKMAKKKGGLVSYDKKEDGVNVYCQVYFGKKLWKLQLTEINLVSLKDLFKSVDGRVQIQYYAYFAYLILKGSVFDELK